MVDIIKRPHVKIVDILKEEPQIINESVNYCDPPEPPSTLYKVLTGGPKRYAFWEAICKEGERLEKKKQERKAPNPIWVAAIVVSILTFILGLFL
jgi:hypothetical protein